ncbi:GtrA family protein [Paraburkholderia mimosarum]|uniref:GtrA family protein n=1 Tax=Paraburkholderia mimosarum TaxID=312026 RepID=UPI0004829B15|nr:GtrA family protein [Paraburkholderia mimosarum]
MKGLHASIRFVLVGLSNTALSLTVIWIALKVFGVSDLRANAIGYIVGFVWSFLLNRSWTFRHRGRLASGLVRFTLVCSAAYVANLLVLFFLLERFGGGAIWTQAVGMVVYTVVSYLGSRYYAFPRASAELAR